MTDDGNASEMKDGSRLVPWGSDTTMLKTHESDINKYDLAELLMMPELHSLCLCSIWDPPEIIY